MASGSRYHEMFTKEGWPVFSSTQTENRIALCKKALCPDRSLIIRFKDCYVSDSEAAKYRKLRFTSEECFNKSAEEIRELAWGGRYFTPKYAIEGGFYPFVRCAQKIRPVDAGIIWIGSRYEYPRVLLNNLVASWLCPYTKSGLVMTEPFEPIGKVLSNWSRLSDRRLYPCLTLPPVPDL